MPFTVLITVLIVEEQLSVRKALERLLESLNLRFRSVSNAAQAQQEAALQPPDLVISSLTLPDQSGLELCRALSQQDLKVVLLGAVAWPEAQAAGAVGSLGMPLELPELRTLLGRLYGPPGNADAPTAFSPAQLRLQQLLARPGVLALTTYDRHSGQMLREFGEALPRLLGQQLPSTFEAVRWLGGASDAPCTFQIDCGGRCLLIFEEASALIACLLRDSARASLMKYWLSSADSAVEKP